MRAWLWPSGRNRAKGFATGEATFAVMLSHEGAGRHILITGPQPAMERLERSLAIRAFLKKMGAWRLGAAICKVTPRRVNMRRSTAGMVRKFS